MEEKSFNADVTKAFVEIADVLTKRAVVIHLPEKERQEFSCLGINKELFQQQIDIYHGWDETELYCYSSNNDSNMDKDSECDLYFIIDVIHANMTIKCRDKDLFQKVKNCMNEIMEALYYNLEKWDAILHPTLFHNSIILLLLFVLAYCRSIFLGSHSYKV